MPFHKIEAEKLSQAVTRQIESLILDGILRPGARLPAERDMAAMMGVSRPSLREALAAMQEDGLLCARPGSGIFVAEILGSAFSPALVRLIARHPEAATDYLEFRKDLEGIAAGRAATKASDGDLEVIADALRRMQAVHDQHDAALDAELDAAFHMAIVEASHNIVALHMMRSMQDLLRAGVLHGRAAALFEETTTRARLLAHHEAINGALQERDGPRARELLCLHLDYVAERLQEAQRYDQQDDLARLRLMRQHGR